MISNSFYKNKLEELHRKVLLSENEPTQEDFLLLVKLLYWREIGTYMREETFEEYWIIE